MTVRWGIAGTGAMAVGFANDLAFVDDAELVAVGSRSPESSRAFADRYGFATAHGSYEDLAADPGVDAIYVATPATEHEAHTLLMLDGGKHVLCEKPFALNAAQARRMVDRATERGLFLMEAMWARFLPPYRRLAELLADGAVGEPRLVEADFGFVMPRNPSDRLWDPNRGGGALLDLGVYPVQLASMVLGTPTSVAAGGFIGDTGVDEQVAAVLGYPNGQLAVVKAAISTNLTCTARIAGTSGTIELPAIMHCPGSVSVVTLGGTEVIDTRWEGGGWYFQVEEVHRCLAGSSVESTVMRHAESISIMGTLDAIRAGIGLRYPGE